MLHKTGAIPDHPDIRDQLFQDFYIALGQVRLPMRGWWPFWRHMVYPDIIDLTTDTKIKFPDVFDQGALSSCVDNAWATLLGYLLSKEGGDPTNLSRLFAYFNARNGITIDNGSSIRSAIKGIATYGIPDEVLWPYVEMQWNIKPPSEVYVAAKNRSGLSYAKLETLDDMLHCLAVLKLPIVFGMSIYEDFEGLSAPYILEMPNKKNAWVGGHGLCIVGYDYNRKLFKVRNSWGVSWGDGGHFWLPFDYINNPVLAYSFWTASYIKLK